MSIDLISYARDYKSAGGSRDAWMAAYDDAPAVDMLGKGQVCNVTVDRSRVADAQQRMSDEGQISLAIDGHDANADVRRQMLSEGQTRRVGDDLTSRANAQQLDASREDQPEAAHEGHHGYVASAGDHIPSTNLMPRADGHILSVGARNHIAGEKAKKNMSGRTSERSPSAREPVAMEQEIQVRRDRKGLYLPKEPSATDVAAAGHAANLTFFQVTKLRGKFLAAYKFGDLKNAKVMNYYENLIIDDLLVFAKHRKISDDVMVSDGIDETELRRIVKRARSSFFQLEAIARG